MNTPCDGRMAGSGDVGKRRARVVAMVLGVVCAGVLFTGFRAAVAGEEPGLPWSSDRRHRIVVRVDPVEVQRDADELVASVEVDFDQHVGEQGCDLSSLQVVGYDGGSGSPAPYALNPHSTTKGERPSRFYDAAIPWDYPEREGYAQVHNQDGSGRPIVITPGGGRFMGAIGDGRKGRIVWAHTQTGGEASHYAIYFNARAPGAPPGMASPGFVGDGSNRCSPESQHFFPSMTTRVDVADIDGDGLFDVLAGDITGKVMWYKNYGEPNRPFFTHPQFVFGDDGDPMDVGYLAGPRAVDWDGDGDLDLVVGTEKESVVLFRNIGSRTSYKFKLEGLMQADGKAIRIPHQPCLEDRAGAMTTDYSPVLEVVDWDGDGDLDLLAGGFVTGMIWLYENIAEKATDEPRLTFRGSLQADGKDLDVTWMAAPTVADFDGDGDLDLISGAWQWEWGTGGKHDPSRFLMYYENTGARTAPKLSHRYPFPSRGAFRHSGSGTPRAVDFNGDGLLDLVVSSGSDLLLVPNVGAPDRPEFDASVTPLKAPWGNDALSFQQLVDYDGDGWVDLFKGEAVDVSKMLGLFSADVVQLDVNGKARAADARPVRLLREGTRIYHPSERGDHWDYRILADLDMDGRMDILVGDNAGHVWFHRDEDEKGSPRVDPEGVRLRLTTGELLSVFDAPSEDDRHPHDDLQGARPTMTSGDFNRDGRRDLVVCNTYGVIYLFLRADGDELVFKPAVNVARVQKIRLTVQSIDWNGDGWDDILATYAGGDTFILVNRARSDDISFEEPEALEMPRYWMSWPFVHVADWNNDGDDDVIFHNGIMMRLVERSFLEHGYVPGAIVGYERNSRGSAR